MLMNDLSGISSGRVPIGAASWAINERARAKGRTSGGYAAGAWPRPRGGTHRARGGVGHVPPCSAWGACALMRTPRRARAARRMRRLPPRHHAALKAQPCAATRSDSSPARRPAWQAGSTASPLLTDDGPIMRPARSPASPKGGAIRGESARALRLGRRARRIPDRAQDPAKRVVSRTSPAPGRVVANGHGGLSPPEDAGAGRSGAPPSSSPTTQRGVARVGAETPPTVRCRQ